MPTEYEDSKYADTVFNEWWDKAGPHETDAFVSRILLKAIRDLAYSAYLEGKYNANRH